MNPENPSSSIQSLVSLWRWRKLILGATAAGAVVSLAVALLLPDYFQSTATFYPLSTQVGDVRALFYEDTDPEVFGTEKDVDRLISLANSTPLKWEVIKKHRLGEHYGLDSSEAKYASRLLDHFEALYSVKKTDRGGVEISLEDKDPQMAFRALSDMLRKVDSLNAQPVLESNRKIFQAYDASLVEKLQDFKRLTDSLSHIRRTFNILDPISQGEQLSTELVRTQSNLKEYKARLKFLEGKVPETDTSIINLRLRVQGLEARQKALTDDSDSDALTLDKFKIGMDAVNSLTIEQQKRAEELTRLRIRTSEALQSLGSRFTSLFVLENPGVPDSKSRPVRSLIVILSTVLSFFFSCLAVLLRGYLQQHVLPQLRQANS